MKTSELIRESLDKWVELTCKEPTHENIESLERLSAVYVRFINIENHDKMMQEMEHAQRNIENVIKTKEVN